MSKKPALVGTVAAQGERVRGLWYGGAYIELHFILDGQDARFYPEPFEVINVMDYDTGEVTIEPTIEGVRGAIEAWAKALEPGELPNYRANVSKAAGGPF